ncbi:hypothetical protein [Nocardia veterana]|uniref:Uncharacterized protein n=1 Tax=Nocardia veterana TaxID=132249 RepID=A0A7X6RJD3_9NOCA|nr:hypothetical protein [Nocardia veterana]NKY87548.1 hypothetical protein [Nocardia veterana]
MAFGDIAGKHHFVPLCRRTGHMGSGDEDTITDYLTDLQHPALQTDWPDGTTSPR